MCIIGHVTRKMTSVIFAVLRYNKVYQRSCLRHNGSFLNI